MRRIFKSALLAATVLAPCTVQAQDGGAQGASEGRDSAEIIVTARKREENLQNVPTSVAVATSDTIDQLGLDNLTDIAKVTPGLVFDDTLGRDGNRPVIRGQANILGQSGVAYFIDGIYYTGSLADYDVDTIERVEVVKGPQSALYGRNTYSGAINIISKLPGDAWEGRVTADIAEHDRYEVTAGIRGPLSDGLSLGVNGRYYDFGGEFTNGFDGSKIGDQSSWSLSGVLNFDKGGPFTATLRGYYNRTDDGQPAIFSQSANENNCLTDNGTLYRGQGRYFCGVIEPRQVISDYTRQFPNREDVGIEADTYNISLKLEAELTDQLTVTSLTGYNQRTQQTLTDGDYSAESFTTAVFTTFPVGPVIGATPPRNLRLGIVGSTIDFSFANRTKTQDVSQEIRFTYESDAVDVIVGGYFFDQDDDSFSIRTVPSDALARAQASAAARAAAICAASPICGGTRLLFAPAVPNARDENLLEITNTAAFGAINWHITPEINLGLEGRYATENIRQVVFDFDEGQARPVPVQSQRKFKEFTPRITLDWQATPDNLIYAIYAEGQKPGGFNGAQAIAAGVPSYEAEDNKSYEIGLKNRFLDGAVIFNIAAFHTKIDGYQLTQNVSVPPNQVSVVTNAGSARINGFELELLARPVDGLSITANYAHADSRFTAGFDENQGVLNDVADDGLVNCSTGDQFPDITGCQSRFGSIDGKRIPRAPVSRAFVDLDYRTPVGGGDWEFFVGGNVTYTSSSFAQVHNLAETGSSTVVDARAGVQNDRYRVQFYVKNLFDEDAVSQILRYADGNNDLRRNFVAGLRPGRRFGVILSAGF